MTQHSTAARHDPVHQEVWELLPWYINETLSQQECTMVESHLQTCTACQAERERCRALAATVQATPQETWEPSQEHFHHLMARIAASIESRTPVQKVWQRLTAWYASCQEVLQHTPRPVQWTLAAQGALALLLLGFIVWQGALWPEEGQYQTLTSGGKAGSVQRPQWRVVFSDSITEKELRALLNSIHGTIVHGPSAMGVYTIAVSRADLLPEHVGTVLATLRAHPQVRLAEPLDGKQR